MLPFNTKILYVPFLFFRSIQFHQLVRKLFRASLPQMFYPTLLKVAKMFTLLIEIIVFQLIKYCYFSIYLPLLYANTMSNYLPLVW